VAPSQSAVPVPTPSLTPTTQPSTFLAKLFAPKTTSVAVAPTATPTPAPVATAVPTNTPAPQPTPPTATQVSYRFQGSGVFYEGTYDAAGLSVGEASKRIAAQRGFSFKYDASPLGWFVTEIGGVQQNPAQNTYWLYFVNGVFGEVSADKKILQPGDSFVWQYGG
jgi:hypothetical protein